MTFEAFLSQLSHNNPLLFDCLKLGGEAEVAVQAVRSEFTRLAQERKKLPVPTFYNADISLALLSYGFTRYLTPELVLETGVGYGVTSALVLLAMERNNVGKLVSIDLPPLADPYGSHTGLVVPEHVGKTRWGLHVGSSRQCLSNILRDVGQIDLFISDSANMYTLQRYEFETVWPQLRLGGVALFNNIGAQFQKFLRSVKGISFHSIWQIEKSTCATGLVQKN
jgi:predicted O-methyltransferase YrrM